MTTVASLGIGGLPELIDALPAGDAALVRRIFRVDRRSARMRVPPGMHGWVGNTFGGLSAVEEQAVVRVSNPWSGEETLFNPLRASRPHAVSRPPIDLSAVVADTLDDAFCHPLEQTTEDTFGRVFGRFCVTAANLARIDEHHGVVVFNEHHPLEFSRDQVEDYLRTGIRWGEKVLETDPEATCWQLWWNALWRAGATMVHGHAQVVATHPPHHVRVEGLREAAAAYRSEHDGDFFADLARAHEILGLARRHRSAVRFASLTPIKEREVWMVDDDLSAPLVDLVYETLERFTRSLGIQSFNLSYFRPPLGTPDPEWAGFPHIVRIVDRGSLDSPMSDFGGFELYGAVGVSADPFALATALAR